MGVGAEYRGGGEKREEGNEGTQDIEGTRDIEVTQEQTRPDSSVLMTFQNSIIIKLNISYCICLKEF